MVVTFNMIRKKNKNGIYLIIAVQNETFRTCLVELTKDDIDSFKEVIEKTLLDGQIGFNIEARFITGYRPPTKEYLELKLKAESGILKFAELSQDQYKQLLKEQDNEFVTSYTIYKYGDIEFTLNNESTELIPIQYVETLFNN